MGSHLFVLFTNVLGVGDSFNAACAHVWIAFGVCPFTDRWYWCVRMDNGQAAALPTAISLLVERMICSHRRDRRTLLQKQPVKWEEKMEQVNSQTKTIVWNIKQSTPAAATYIKRSTRLVKGQLEFQPGCGKGFELIRLEFSLNEGSDVAGRGTYWLSSKNYPKRAICCISTTGERNGFDILRENYAGNA